MMSNITADDVPDGSQPGDTTNISINEAGQRRDRGDGLNGSMERNIIIAEGSISNVFGGGSLAIIFEDDEIDIDVSTSVESSSAVSQLEVQLAADCSVQMSQAIVIDDEVPVVVPTPAERSSVGGKSKEHSLADDCSVQVSHAIVIDDEVPEVVQTSSERSSVGGESKEHLLADDCSVQVSHTIVIDDEVPVVVQTPAERSNMGGELEEKSADDCSVISSHAIIDVEGEMLTDEPCMFSVLCPADGGYWAKLTCVLGLMAMFVVEGITLSQFLMDSRVGMNEYLPRPRFTLEPLAVTYLFRYLTEPFACALVNRYGFRYTLFIGSTLCVSWLASVCFVENALFVSEHFVFAMIGGIGMGMIKTAFFVLLSTLFVVNRHKAHLCLHLGSFAGMMFIPALTGYLLLSGGLEMATYMHLVLMCCTLILWLSVATPSPLNMEIVDEESRMFPWSPSTTKSVPWNAEKFAKKNQPPTIFEMIGKYRQFWVGRFLANMPMADVEDHAGQFRYYLTNSLYCCYEEHANSLLPVRNMTNMFRYGLIGSRPMYRDDVLFDGNVIAFAPHLKNVRTGIVDIHEYLLAMTRIFSLDDLHDERSQLFRWKWSEASCRVLRSMFHMPIWTNEQFLLTAVIEAFIHAACFIPFMFINVSLNSFTEAAFVLVTGGFGLLAGRGIGYVLHEKSSFSAVPLYQVGMVLVANGLSLVLCDMALNDFAKLLPFFGLFGVCFGYYKSIQNVVLYSAFPVRKLNNVCGQISLVRAVSSFAGILIAVYIRLPENDHLSARSNNVYVYTGMLMLAAAVCVFVLQRSVINVTAGKPRLPKCQEHRCVFGDTEHCRPTNNHNVGDYDNDVLDRLNTYNL